MTVLAPFLWFDGKAEEAATFYVSLLPDARIDRIVRAPVSTPGGTEGDVLVVEFTLAGRAFVAMNGGPGHPFNDAVSLQLLTENQSETDRLWDGLIADGGSGIACGWCRDRYGLSWQVTPRRLMALIGDPDQARAGRAMQAMMTMVKIDIAALEAAAGTPE